jgi:hypothetical protein
MDYCDVVWGNSCKKFTSKLSKLQNKAGKAILKVNKRFPTSLMLDCLEWEDIHTRRNFHLNVMVYNCISGKAPSYLCDVFDILADNSSYFTRGSAQGNLRPPNLEQVQASALSNIVVPPPGINFPVLSNNLFHPPEICLNRP